MSNPERRDGIDEPTAQWQPSALGADFPDTRTIRSHRALNRRPPRLPRALVIVMVLAVLVTGGLVAQAAIGGGSPAPVDTPRPRITRTDALASDAPSLSPPMVWQTSATPSPATPSPSATAVSPAPSPTPRPATPPAAAPTPPAPFVPVSVEAETAVLRGSASAVGCPPCSGGLRVGYLSADSSIVVRVDVPRSGTRTVQVTYETDGLRQLKIQLNGLDVDTRWVDGGGWEIPMAFEFPVTMPAGTVELRFYNDISPAPDIDKVAIS